jgi:hypothetical protein
MDETLHKPKCMGLNYDQLSKIIMEKYVECPDLREIAKELGISVSEVFEVTGWKDYYEFLVDRD